MGAFGEAKAGRDHRQILDHYYRGTELDAAPQALLDRVRVLVADGARNVTVENAVAVFDAAGKRYPTPTK